MSPKAEVTCLVSGVGAVGATIAGRLKFCDQKVVLWGRFGYETRKFGFSGWGKKIILRQECNTNFSDIKIAFVAVKSYDLSSSLLSLCPGLADGAIVIPVCNGAVDTIVEKFSRDFPNLLWRHGVCLFGSSEVENLDESIERSYVLSSSVSRVVWGPVSGSLLAIQTEEERIVSADKEEFFSFDDYSNLIRKKKWLFNTVMNTLCAVKKYSKNGMLLDEMGDLKLVFEEAYQLYGCLWGEPELNREAFWNQLLKFIDETFQNENSMARDVRLGRKTETEYLAGMALGYSGFPELKKFNSILS